MAKSGKRIRQIYNKFDRFADHEIADAVKIVLEAKKTNFDETVEIAVNLGVDPRHSDQMVRGVVSLPNGTGKTTVVAVFAKADKAEEAMAAGAEFVGAQDLADKIEKANKHISDETKVWNWGHLSRNCKGIGEHQQIQSVKSSDGKLTLRYLCFDGKALHLGTEVNVAPTAQ